MKAIKPKIYLIADLFIHTSTFFSKTGFVQDKYRAISEKDDHIFSFLIEQDSPVAAEVVLKNGEIVHKRGY